MRLEVREAEAWSEGHEAGGGRHDKEFMFLSEPNTKGKPLKNFKSGYTAGFEETKRLTQSNVNSVDMIQGE